MAKVELPMTTIFEVIFSVFLVSVGLTAEEEGITDGEGLGLTDEFGLGVKLGEGTGVGEGDGETDGVGEISGLAWAIA